MLSQVYFWIFAAIAAASALRLLTARHPLSGAMALIGVMLSLGGIYSVLDAPFLGVVQVLVYAGAIMMLVVFVIMVVNGAKDHVLPVFDRTSLVLLLVPAALCATLVPVLQLGVPAADESASRGTVEAIAARLFDTSNGGAGLPILFELSGLVLLSAMVAAVVLAKRKLEETP